MIYCLLLNRIKLIFMYKNPKDTPNIEIDYELDSKDVNGKTLCVEFEKDKIQYASLYEVKLKILCKKKVKYHIESFYLTKDISNSRYDVSIRNIFDKLFNHIISSNEVDLYNETISTILDLILKTGAIDYLLLFLMNFNEIKLNEENKRKLIIYS